MSSTVQGMPRVISDNELTTGLTKASPVVIPDKMPMTTLNLDLKQIRTTKVSVFYEQHCVTVTESSFQNSTRTLRQSTRITQL